MLLINKFRGRTEYMYIRIKSKANYRWEVPFHCYLSGLQQWTHVHAERYSYKAVSTRYMCTVIKGLKEFKHLSFVFLQLKSSSKSIIQGYIFTFVHWALYKINWGSFCMNRTTFRDPWVGGVLVKTCIIEFRQSTFLKEKQIKIKFSFLFGLTDS